MFDAPAKALPGVVRTHNAAVVLQQLRLHAPLSRADLAKRIGLNRSTVSSIVTQLLYAGLIQETDRQTDKLGRPGLSLAINPAGGCAVGVEIDAAGVCVVLTDFTAHTLRRRSVQVDAGESQGDLFALCRGPGAASAGPSPCRRSAGIGDRRGFARAG